MGTYKFGNNTYPPCIRCRSNLGHIFQEKKCVLWAGKYGMSLKNSNDTIGNRTRDLPVCSVVP